MINLFDMPGCSVSFMYKTIFKETLTKNIYMVYITNKQMENNSKSAWYFLFQIN